MIYEVIHPMSYCRNGSATDLIVIPAGSVVTSVPYASMEPQEAVACRRMAARHRTEHPTTRMIFFAWEGVMRGAAVGPDLRRAPRRNR